MNKLQMFASENTETEQSDVSTQSDVAAQNDSGVTVQSESSRASEAVKGRKIVYLFRVAKNSKTAAGTTLAFTTENGRTKSKDADSTATKDGSIRTPGEAEVEITATSILKKGDSTIDDLEDAMDDDGLIEIWEANLDDPASSGENRYKGRYFTGYLTELEKTSNAEDFVECSLTFGINGKGVKGDVTVTTAQQEAANEVFKDTVQEA